MKNKLLSWDNYDQIGLIAKSLLEGRVVVGSGDTVLGLLANTTIKGFQGLNSIKQRNEKPYIILLDDIGKLKYFVSQMPTGKRLALLQKCWPGPLTILFKANSNLSDFLISKDQKVAIRIPAHQGLLGLLKNFNGLFSTSANLTGQPIPACLSALDPQILQMVDLLIVDSYNSDDHQQAILPSTILDFTADHISIIRAGAYSIDELEEFYGDKFL